MAKRDHVALVRERKINDYKARHPAFRADLKRADFRQCDLRELDLRHADLSYARFDFSRLYKTDLRDANLASANFDDSTLQRIRMSGANLTGSRFLFARVLASDFSGADLSGADLTGIIFRNSILDKATLCNADLTNAVLSGCSLKATTVTGCRVYGSAAWQLDLVGAQQKDLLITHPMEPDITVDNIEIAQFLHLLIRGSSICNALDTITAKVVLLLGSFGSARKRCLDAIREIVRTELNLIPLLVDFGPPRSKDLTGIIETLARLSRFVFADLSDPSSIPHELATITPYLSRTPILSVRQADEQGYTMFSDLQHRYPSWVLPTYEYENCESLLAALPTLFSRANEKAEELRTNQPVGHLRG